MGYTRPVNHIFLDHSIYLRIPTGFLGRRNFTLPTIALWIRDSFGRIEQLSLTTEASGIIDGKLTCKEPLSSTDMVVSGVSLRCEAMADLVVPPPISIQSYI